MTKRQVKVTRAEVLAAQLLERLNKRTGSKTDPRVSRIAQAGREVGVVLPDDVSVSARSHQAKLGRLKGSVKTAKSERKIKV